MSQVKLSSVGHSAVSSPPTLWQCQTLRPLPILLVLLLIREPASQGLGRGGRKGVGHRGPLVEKHKGNSDTEQDVKEKICYLSALTTDNVYWSTKIYYVWPVSHVSCWDNDAVKKDPLSSKGCTALLDKLFLSQRPGCERVHASDPQLTHLLHWPEGFSIV